MNEEAPLVSLARTYRDSVTGVTGVCTVKAQFISGVPRAQIEWQSTDGHHHECWFDESRLTPVDS